MFHMVDHNSILQWGERDGVLYYVDNVANGLECECVCCHCGQPLVAKNRGLIKIHHFAHFSEFDCDKAVESAVHKLAKQVLANTRTLMLPSCEGYGPKGMQEYISEIKVTFDNIETEVNIEIYGETIRPDAIGCFKGKQIYIEFCFTHSVSEPKRAQIKKANTSCVEVLLDIGLQEPGKMETFLQDSIEARHWVFHRALERLVLADYEKERERIKIREKRLAEQDKQRRIREEAQKRIELEKQRRRLEFQRRMEAKQQVRLEVERQKRERELAEAETKGNLYKYCPIVGHFLEKFYNTPWGQNEIINALRNGVWFQRKIFYYWPDKAIDIFVDNKQYIIVPRKEDYDQLPEEQRRYHDYLLESVQKYDKLYHRSFNHCSFCNMFVGNVQEFIICKYNQGDETAGCLNYDKL